MSPVRSPYDHLVRAVIRAEANAVELADRAAQRIGDVPPTRALHAVAEHAADNRERLARVLVGHGIDATAPRHRMSDMCRWLIGRIVDVEHAYGEALDELRREVDTVRELRAMARMDALFGVIRWCDDWVPARRRWLALVEAQQAWFVSPGMAPPLPPMVPASVELGEVVTLPRFLDYL